MINLQSTYVMRPRFQAHANYGFWSIDFVFHIYIFIIVFFKMAFFTRAFFNDVVIHNCVLIVILPIGTRKVGAAAIITSKAANIEPICRQGYLTLV